jgi:CDP-Glycerol:Poly(glycerophosphate) glycerophosphotransferase
LRFLDSWREHRRFHHLSPEQRNLVFYAESGHDWHHFEPLVARLTGELGRTVCYVSSDPEDPGLRREDERLLRFCIPPGSMRIVFFQLLDADVFVLTMLDLGNFELRRSVHPVHYVYLFHGTGSTHMVDHANSYDHYDTIFCAGPHQVREIRRREELAGLPPKQLVEHGYTRIETLVTEAERRRPRREPGEPPVVLVAPTWGEHSILNACGERLVEILLGAGHRVIVRPHYHTIVLTPEVVERIRDRFGGESRFEYVGRMGERDSLFRSDLLICDWSSMAVEYALGLGKPVLFLDLPKRERNPDWRKWGLEPIEIAIRPQVGAVLDPERLAEAPARIAELLEAPAAFAARMAALREQWVFNPGRSAEVGTRELARIADARAAERRGRGR